MDNKNICFLTGGKRPPDILGIGPDLSSHFSRQLQCIFHVSEGDPDPILNYCAILCGFAMIADLNPANPIGGNDHPCDFLIWVSTQETDWENSAHLVTK
jgi:hypothetical protein